MPYGALFRAALVLRARVQFAGNTNDLARVLSFTAAGEPGARGPGLLARTGAQFFQLGLAQFGIGLAFVDALFVAD